MKYLKNAFELYINSSIHVSLAVVAFTIITFLEYDLFPDQDLLLFIFFSSITGYNFVKYAGIAKLHHLSLAKNLRIIQVFSGISFLALLYFCFLLKSAVLIATGILGIFTLLYAIPLFGGDRNLRSLPGIKIFIIALVWAGTTQILPVINAEMYLGKEILLDFFQRLLMVIVITLPFEIRDLNFDSEKLGTIPQKLGILRTKVFGTFLIGLIFSIELFQKSFNSNEFLSLVLILLIMGMMLWYARDGQKKFYASFWVESLPILFLGIYLFFRNALPQILF